MAMTMQANVARMAQRRGISLRISMCVYAPDGDANGLVFPRVYPRRSALQYRTQGGEEEERGRRRGEKEGAREGTEAKVRVLAGGMEASADAGQQPFELHRG